jgi:hypothetical protein
VRRSIQVKIADAAPAIALDDQLSRHDPMACEGLEHRFELDQAVGTLERSAE